MSGVCMCAGVCDIHAMSRTRVRVLEEGERCVHVCGMTKMKWLRDVCKYVCCPWRGEGVFCSEHNFMCVGRGRGETLMW